MDPLRVADRLNTIARFVGPRDLREPTMAELQRLTGRGQVDAVVLYGGSVLAGAQVLADVMRAGIARTAIISGGEGHTTATLRAQAARLYPKADLAADATEADIFSAILSRCFGLEADHLERASTNCGNNVTCVLDLMRANAIPTDSVIVIQDATMQRRMAAGFALRSPGTTVVNYPSYQATVVAENDGLDYSEDILGMWDVRRYATLLMGEVPRLLDDEDGYGPRGKGWIAHVDVPDSVREAFRELRSSYPELVREANPAFAGGTSASSQNVKEDL